MEKDLSFIETARDVARRAARTSPQIGSQEGLIWEQADMMQLEWSPQTAACAFYK